MERTLRGGYTREFRQQAVKLVEDEGLAEAARRLSMAGGRLKNWLAAARAGKLQEVSQDQKPLTDTELELARLRKELAELTQERDLLKKFAAYFSKKLR